jgi:hypothetical protein
VTLLLLAMYGPSSFSTHCLMLSCIFSVIAVWVGVNWNSHADVHSLMASDIEPLFTHLLGTPSLENVYQKSLPIYKNWIAFFWVVLAFNSALGLPGRRSTTKGISQPFLTCYFSDRLWSSFAQGKPQTTILLPTASHIAKIAGSCHHTGLSF